MGRPGETEYANESTVAAAIGEHPRRRSEKGRKPAEVRENAVRPDPPRPLIDGFVAGFVERMGQS
jgi:hypothetical protein